MTRSRCTVAVLLLAVLVAGCSSIGPGSIPRDRFQYGAAVATSWQAQTLLNIVKLRYLDMPMFLDVGQIVSGYTLEGAVGIGGSLSDGTLGNTLALNGQGRFQDRPTITYSPMTGARFLRGLLTPLEPRAVFSMIQSGYAADFVLDLTLVSLNGLRNRRILGGDVQPADPGFQTVVDTLRAVQSSGAVGMRTDTSEKAPSGSVLFFRQEGLPDAVLAQVREAKRLLGLPDEQRQYELVYSPVRAEPGKLGVETRSILSMLLVLASDIQVPDQDLTDQRAFPATADTARMPLLQVHVSPSEEPNAFVSVNYRGQWFWIDDRDLRSKRTFAFIMFLFTMADTGEEAQAPVLTIPTS